MNQRPRIGWVLDTSPQRVWPLPWDGMSPVGRIRYGGIARYLDKTSSLQMERYRPWNRYEAVVFVKMMSEAAYTLARNLKKKGTRVVFDANVNYYESFGDFRTPGTQPTETQREQAVRMTQLADVVVADSSYLCALCKTLNPKTIFIPDAVDTDFFKPRSARPSSQKRPMTLIWSGIGKKADHLELIEDVLMDLKGQIHLVLVPSPKKPFDRPAAVLERLREQMGAAIFNFDYKTYPRRLEEADIIISPKDLRSSYELAHTEYKITLGMSMGLPAIASPQQSYKEAIGDGSGGHICSTPEDWRSILKRYLSDPRLLEVQGVRARDRVLSRYAIPVVAPHYAQVLEEICRP